MKYLFIILIILIIINIISYYISIYFYNLFFRIRYDTLKRLRFKEEDFPNLKRDKYEYLSGKNKLVGYNYYYSKENTKGIIVLTHGFGAGGHNSYIDCISYLAKNNYYVFAFDFTGYDESGGKYVNGLPQGIIDLDNTLKFIKKQKDLKNLPVFLFSHSWGAYAALNVLKMHPEVKATIALAPFNNSFDLLRTNSVKRMGKISLLGLIYIKLYEKIKFGKYANQSCIKNLEKVKSGIMIVQSKEDIIVPIKYSYDVFYKYYKNKPNFKFKLLDNHGHIKIYYRNNNNNIGLKYDEYYSQKQLCFKKNNNLKLPDDIIKNNNLLDEELFKEIINFYNYYLEH